MYGRLNERKIKEEDYVLSCEKARQQLNQYIDLQAKRVNIDSAKKRAVLQHMDYEGFRQMVLGANIFATKSTQLYSFSKGQHKQTITNRLFKQDEQAQMGSVQILNKKLEQQQAEDKNTQRQLFNSISGKSELQCSSFRQFKKKFNSYYKPQLSEQVVSEVYTLIKNQNQIRLEKIFNNMQCQANILLKIINIFNFIVENYAQRSQPIIKEMLFMVKFLYQVLTFKNMKEFNLAILNKKQKQRIIDFLEKGQQVISPLQQKSKQSVNQNNVENSEDKKLIQQLTSILKK